MTEEDQYAAAWSTLAAVAAIVGGTVDEEPEPHRAHRILRLSPFHWCEVRATNPRGWGSPISILHVTAPREIGGSYCCQARVSLSRTVACIAADLRRRVLDPCKEPLRAYFAQKQSQEARELARRQTMAQIESALGEPLKQDYSRRLRTPSDSCVMDEHAATFHKYDGRPEFTATFTVDNLPAFLMMCRIAGESARLKQLSKPAPHAH